MSNRRILLDEFHLQVWIPAGLNSDAVAAARRVLNQGPFSLRLRRAVAQVLRSYPALQSASVRIAR
jgi:hypothetical protein